jgi:hypothetical protein
MIATTMDCLSFICEMKMDAHRPRCSFSVVAIIADLSSNGVLVRS